ncbi:hypothetical protein MEO94_28765 [Dolichospermum sp. ST_sed9]|nr:hypothetical protein [Dolichospermum sp. ST_sed9]
MYLIRAETAVRYEDRTPFTPPTSDRTPITAIALPHPQKEITFPHPQTAIPRSRFAIASQYPKSVALPHPKSDS